MHRWGLAWVRACVSALYLCACVRLGGPVLWGCARSQVEVLLIWVEASRKRNPQMVDLFLGILLSVRDGHAPKKPPPSLPPGILFLPPSHPAPTVPYPLWLFPAAARASLPGR
jgi:hypothetical protein